MFILSKSLFFLEGDDYEKINFVGCYFGYDNDGLLGNWRG